MQTENVREPENDTGNARIDQRLYSLFEFGRLLYELYDSAFDRGNKASGGFVTPFDDGTAENSFNHLQRQDPGPKSDFQELTDCLELGRESANQIICKKEDDPSLLAFSPYAESFPSAESTGLDHNSKEIHWEIEDQIELERLAKSYKEDWKKILGKFRLRHKHITKTYLQNRYRISKGNYYSKRIRFSFTEDLTIIHLYKEHGIDWPLIAQYLPSRTPIMIKNRFYNQINKKYKHLLAGNLVKQEYEEGNCSNSPTTSKESAETDKRTSDSYP